jgi:ABC-type multidrug transport system fused ATPase/permease subunit
MMISGCSLSAYWIGNYIADILFQAVPALVGIAGIHLFNIDVPKVEWIFLVVVFANPAFIYAFSFLFDKDEAGSLVIKMVFFLLGIIAPITISILQVVNETTQDVANILKWFFYPFPVYSLTFGYMSIANRALIQFVQKLNEEPAIFSSQIAGPSLYFLIGAVPFYWILVICFEQKVFDFSAYRNRNPNGRDQDLTRSSVARGYNPLSIDEDIVEEMNRVKDKEPKNLPVRVLNLKKTYGSVVAVENVSFGLEYGECFALLGVSGAGKTTCFKSLTGEIYPSRGKVTINGNDISTARGF